MTGSIMNMPLGRILRFLTSFSISWYTTGRIDRLQLSQIIAPITVATLIAMREINDFFISRFAVERNKITDHLSS